MQEVLTDECQFKDCSGLVSEEILSEIENLTDRLKGLRVIHINATQQGGGVAEILKSLVPLCRSVGVDAEWYVIPPDESFFAVAKSLYHSLQGNLSYPTREQIELYLRHNERITLELKSRPIAADVRVIHDHQVVPLADSLPDTAKIVWNSHSDTTEPSGFVQDILMPFINRYDQVIFTLEQYVFDGCSRDKVRIFAPAIDPLSPKNVSLSSATAKQKLSELGLDQRRPLVTHVSRFDRWKDPWGVIDAYSTAKRSIPNLQLALVGDLAAQDDPDAHEVLCSVQEYAGDDSDIHLFSNRSVVAEREVNAFQTVSDVVVQKSVREGFGLTVAQAMWGERLLSEETVVASGSRFAMVKQVS